MRTQTWLSGLVLTLTAAAQTAHATNTVPTGKLPDDAKPLAYTLALKIDPHAERFSGEARIKVKLAKAADHVFLHARELDIAKVEVIDAKGKAHAAKFATRDESGVIEVMFGATLPAQEIELAFDYVVPFNANL